jgi:integrase
MASIHKDSRGKSPYWYCYLTLPGGRRAKRSTKTGDRKKAERICLEWGEAARKADAGRLTENAARRIIADIYELANGESLPAATVEVFFESWLAKKAPETSPATARAYADTAARFLAYLGERKGLEMSRISKADVAGFRDSFTKRGLAKGTANVALKIIRGAFTEAQRDGIVSENVAALVGGVKVGKTAKRRSLTNEEIERALEAADDEWRGIILAGLYTGQRLGDIAGYTWENLNLARGELKFVTIKTERQQIIPLAKPLLHFFESLPAGDNPKQPLFPAAYAAKQRAKGKKVGTLSNQFNAILAKAGLVEKRTHKKRGGGRAVARTTGQISFHCLRRNTTSLLVNAGISRAVVQEFVGHDSVAVSEHYTDIAPSSMQAAADSLPDFTPKARKGAK